MNKYEFSIVTNDYQETKIIANNLKTKLLKLKAKENIVDPDIVFIVGGDGTFLKAVNQYNKNLEKIKFITFHQGKIGFYHNFLVSEMEQILHDIYYQSDNFYVNELDLIEIENNNQKYYAVNEARLVNFAQTLNCQIFINDELLEVFRGTGVIFSTKTGSTGLMKSTNAAIIIAKEKLMEMQEIFPVNNNLYRTLRAPLILGSNQAITLKFTENFKKKITNQQLIVDTFVIHDKLKEIKVKLSNLNLKMLVCKKQDESLIKKLNKTFIQFDK